nr:hypothetical protein [Candidatus Woesearchaeota archaeon]
MFNPNTHVDDVVVLVTDENNARSGQIGKLVEHDWKEYGQFYVIFKDDKIEKFPDGWMKDDPTSPVKTFYRKNDSRREEFDKEEAGLKSFIQTYLKLDIGSIERLKKDYQNIFGEELPQINY